MYVSTRLEMASTGISKQDLDDDENVQPDKIKYLISAEVWEWRNMRGMGQHYLTLTRYEGQLEGVAFLGRLEPMSSATTLCKHLNERLSALSQGHQVGMFDEKDR
jgi:hypothetical protein